MTYMTMVSEFSSDLWLLSYGNLPKSGVWTASSGIGNTFPLHIKHYISVPRASLHILPSSILLSTVSGKYRDTSYLTVTQIIIKISWIKCICLHVQLAINSNQHSSTVPKAQTQHQEAVLKYHIFNEI